MRNEHTNNFLAGGSVFWVVPLWGLSPANRLLWATCHRSPHVNKLSVYSRDVVLSSIRCTSTGQLLDYSYCKLRLPCRRPSLHNQHLEFLRNHYCRCYCRGKTHMAWRIRSFWRLTQWRWWAAKIDDFINGYSDRNAWLEIVRPLRWRRWQVGSGRVGAGQVCEMLKWQLIQWIEEKPV